MSAQPLPKIDSVELVRLADPPGAIQIIVRGRGMTGDWEVKGAQVGRTPLSGVVAYPRGEGFVALAASEPPDFSEITIKGTKETHFAVGRFSLDKVKGAPRVAVDKREDCKFPVVPGKSIGPFKLGMSVAELGKLGAKLNPQSSVWYELGPITAKVDKASGKVDMMWISRPTMCLVDGGKQLKLDLPRPTTATPSPFPFPDCAWPTEPMIGGACFQCTSRGMQVCHGASGWFPEVKVQPAKP